MGRVARVAQCSAWLCRCSMEHLAQPFPLGVQSLSYHDQQRTPEELSIAEKEKVRGTGDTFASVRVWWAERG